MSGQRNRTGTRSAGLKARVPLSQVSAGRERRLREEGRWQPGSTFARAVPGRQAPGELPAGLGLGVRAPKRAAPRRETGFPAAVKLAVRVRAGHGDADNACCEACGTWLGKQYGQVHHRKNRQMGGSRLRNGTANASLLCGTPLTGCHGEATRLGAHMRAMGFVLRSTDDPEAEPIMLHGPQGGFTTWLTADGRYSYQHPAKRGGAA